MKGEGIMEENKKNNKTKTILDWVVTGLMLIALVVIYFFWGCKMDLWVTILAAVIVIAGTVLLQMQNRKIKKMNE